jgi:hypothetical protein
LQAVGALETLVAVVVAEVLCIMLDILLHLEVLFLIQWVQVALLAQHILAHLHQTAHRLCLAY